MSVKDNAIFYSNIKLQCNANYKAKVWVTALVSNTNFINNNADFIVPLSETSFPFTFKDENSITEVDVAKLRSTIVLSPDYNNCPYLSLGFINYGRLINNTKAYTQH